MRNLNSEAEIIKTESGSLKISENSHTKQEPVSSDNSSICDLKKNSSSLDFDSHSLTTVASLNSLINPTNLSIPSLKFEENTDIEIQSPDYSFLESFLSDHLDGDFMICSPVRNAPSPQASNYFNYNYGHSLVGSSPNGSHKGKGLSPVHRVLNSPGNQFMQVDQVESLSMPALESLLDDDTYGNKDNDDLIAFLGGGSAEGYDTLTNVPTVTELLECLTMPNSTRFCDSVVRDQASSSSVSQVTQESCVYQHQVGSIAAQPLLSYQLQQERQQEWLNRQIDRQLPQPPPRIQRQPPQAHQEHQMQNMHNTLMVPIIEPEQEHDSGLQLVHLLLACAEAVSKEDYMLARRYLHHLNRVVSALGDSMQRVASCFVEALSARLTESKPSTSNSRPFNPFPPNNLEILKIYQILYQACPYIKFAHFTANQAIFEAFEAEERVHIIDLDILQGYQWPAFMQALAARPGGAPFLRITGVGPCLESAIETGRCLADLAHSLHVPFEFHPVGEELEDLKPHMFNRRVGEALAVNSVNRLHRVPGSCLGSLLTMIRDQAPNIVTIVEQEASHNGPYFLGRFLEALHYYSAIFDSLDATFPPDSAQRAKVEQSIFAPVIKNIVAHEGPERVMRHERLEKWRKIMEGKGFQGVPLSSNAVTQSRILLGLYSCDGYRLTEDKGCLLLGWQDRHILAASAWRC